MRLVSLDRLAPGAMLGADVHEAGSDGPPLLRRGVAITPRYVTALAQKGVCAVWVDDDLSEGMLPSRLLSDDTERAAVGAVGAALFDAGEALAEGRGLSSTAIDELEQVAELIAREVHGSPAVGPHLEDMMGADKYLLQHVVDVTALGTVLAARLFRRNGWVDFDGRRRVDAIDPRLAKIALGLMLHDIGKLMVSQEILNKPGRLTEGEWEEIRRHPQAGADMLGDNVSFLIRAVVKQHHERWDGLGYPDGKTGEEIHQFARIAAVADVYDAVTADRPYRRAMAPHEGVKVVQDGAGSHFDPEVVAIFSKVVLPFPPGVQVQLADGRTGLVVEADEWAPYEPTVRVQHSNGSIEEIPRAPLALAMAA
jgi:HD-GYP domain-containing protein (c-di-GMP phosphodiesterase class II)